MKLWLVSTGFLGYDTYDSFVCAAETEDEARRTHPNNQLTWGGDNWLQGDYPEPCHCWVDAHKIDGLNVRFIGNTDLPAGVVLASFNAG